MQRKWMYTKRFAFLHHKHMPNVTATVALSAFFLRKFNTN